MTSVDENVIKLTIETLGKVVKQVPLNEKLLSRPPFKFLHDIIKEIIRNNGFLSGLYTDDELSSENINNKEAKINFLQKTIDTLGFIVNKPLDHIKANKIVAGLEVDHTNELLQILSRCVISRKESSRAVQRVLKGEKPGLTNTLLTVNDDLLVDENDQKKETNLTKLVEEKSSKSLKTKTNSAKKSPITDPKKSSTNLNKSVNDNNKSIKNSTNLTKPKTPTNLTKSTSVTKPKTPTKSTNLVTKKSTPITKSTQPKTTINKPIAQKTPTNSNLKNAKERIAKPVTKPSTNNKSVNKTVKESNPVNQTNETSIPKNRTLTKEELNTIQANKLNNRADDEEEIKNLENVNTINESNSLELTNQNVISKSIMDQTENLENENEINNENLENTDDVKRQQIKEESNRNEENNQRQSAITRKSAKSIVDRTVNEQQLDKNKNEISRSVRRPIVSSMQIDKQSNNDKQKNNKSIEEKPTTQRPTTASRPLTARAAPPRAVSRRALKEETSNTLEQASLARPQTSIKQILVTNLIKESNTADSLDDDDDDALENDKRTSTASKEKTILNDNIDKIDEQDDYLLNKNLNIDDTEKEKGSLVKKLMKSKMDLEGLSVTDNQNKVSSASLVRSNRDIERLKEHIQTLTKLANPLSKLLDNLQEDIDLMLLEERNWLEEQQRNEQKLLTLREQMNLELNELNVQISNLDDQIQQEKDSILVTNVNLLINQSKLEDIVTRMIEN